MSQTKAQLIDPVDGTIVNADINASAAIAGTKISPDFGSQNITTTGIVKIADGSVSAPAIAFTDDLDTGIFSVSQNTINFTTGGVERLEIGTSLTVFNDGGADVDFRIEGDTDANLFKLDAGNDRIGIGISAPQQKLHIAVSDSGAANIVFTNSTTGSASGDGLIIGLTGAEDGQINMQESANLKFSTADTERMRIDSSGNLGLGTLNPLKKFMISAGGDDISMVVHRPSSGLAATDTCGIAFSQRGDTADPTSDIRSGIFSIYNGSLFLATEAGGDLSSNPYDHSQLAITGTGQILMGSGVGLSAVRNNGVGNKMYQIITKGNGSGNAPTAYNADEEYLHLGGTEYSDGSGNLGQYFIGFGYTNGVAGDHSPCAIGMNTTTESGYTKGNFVIRTRSGVAQNSTTSERLTVQSNGNVTTIVGGFVDRTQAGFTARINDSVSITRLNGSPMEVNRQSNDGNLITFYQGNSHEGDIAVSGSSVVYNGGCLSRWSQLSGISKTDKSARPTIYQGTVMSNLDELCTWEHADELWTEQDEDDGVLPADKNVGDVKTPAYTEDNQQLNITKVSDTEGDKDVAGVFWAWDDDDDEIVNDFYIAMTGDMVIRVAGSTTVARGDLLISAGDGTAKPQADDIVRSSTIAKIISTNHTATYPDGSKAYPCVLMAC